MTLLRMVAIGGPVGIMVDGALRGANEPVDQATWQLLVGNVREAIAEAAAMDMSAWRTRGEREEQLMDTVHIPAKALLRALTNSPKNLESSTKAGPR